MSGSPAPKDPTDWWHQCEVAMPGFIREGHIFKFKNRMCLMKDAQGANGVYKELVTWLDNEKKCKKCGKFADDPCHTTGSNVFGNGSSVGPHMWEPSVNEIHNLYKRMTGLVLVKFKKDVLKFLPEKRYEVVNCPPSNSTIRTARVLSKTAKNVMTGMTMLRELSDGFQYVDVAVGKMTCPKCQGTKLEDQWFDPADPTRRLFDIQNIPNAQVKKVSCEPCGGSGEVTKYERETQMVPCPKEDALIDLLDNHEDVGRVVIYAGFTGSIDRCVDICHRQGWTTIRVDARGWSIMDYNNNPVDNSDSIKVFQELKDEHPRVAFIGQPGAAGMGLTLTASPSIIYYSNDFNGENRIQSEDRIHRPGMDLNRGATIYDLIHLPSDLLVLKNLQKKRELQAMSMGELTAILEEGGERLV
jgi:predicted nucleic-acid-binding Zn-ribbon protein